MLQWLWCRPAATAPIQSLAWDLPYAAVVAEEEKEGNIKRKRNHNKTGRRCRDSLVKTCTPTWVTHKQEDNYKCRGSAQGVRGPGSTLGSPRLGGGGSVLQWKDEPLEHLALKVSGAYFWESHRAVGNRDSTLKSTQKMSQTMRPGAEAVI